ncbi:MAG: S24 family peptidase [Polaromonas sp.]|uniref:S24 family peptidase n=1 Tax=Polaromonas sp. TaxID=1869339 RepID=UPI002722D025|nr:S24 family peptidase [Polaromonas sp.]MDO9112614.1 S24 family peptidase [Polaromonas sp.]MDP1887255.1 S24 family peptidase [Polaromonas sp.]
MLSTPDSSTSHGSTYADATSPADDTLVPDCAGGESFALMVLGHSMAPEFNEGEIIIIEPDGMAQDGSYVLAWHQQAWTFRQLLRVGAGWVLHPLNPAFADAPLPDLSAVRGVIIQKALPGRRRASKHYL